MWGLCVASAPSPSTPPMLQQPDLAALTNAVNAQHVATALQGLQGGALISPLTGLAPAATAAFSFLTKIDKDAQDKADERRARRYIHDAEQQCASRCVCHPWIVSLWQWLGWDALNGKHLENMAFI